MPLHVGRMYEIHDGPGHIDWMVAVCQAGKGYSDNRTINFELRDEDLSRDGTSYNLPFVITGIVQAAPPERGRKSKWEFCGVYFPWLHREKLVGGEFDTHSRRGWLEVRADHVINLRFRIMNTTEHMNHRAWLPSLD